MVNISITTTHTREMKNSTFGSFGIGFSFWSDELTRGLVETTGYYWGLLHKDLWKGMGCFLYGLRTFEKTGFCQKRILEKYNHFLQEKLIFLSTNELFKKLSSRIWTTGKTLHASCLWLHFSKLENMLGPLWPNIDTSGIEWPQTKNYKNRKLFFFGFLVPFWFRRHHVIIPWKGVQCSVTSSKFLFRVFITIRSAGAFRSLQKLTGTKSYHGPFRVNVPV